MIFQRSKERNYAENKSTTHNNLCSKEKQVEFNDSRSSEKKDSYSNLECGANLKDSCEEDPVEKIGDLLASVNIEDKKEEDERTDTYKSEEKEVSQLPKNIVCERNDTQEKNIQVLERNIIEDDNDNSCGNDKKYVTKFESKEENKENDEVPDCSFLCEDEKNDVSDCEDKLQKQKSNEAKKVDSVLCSRGPIYQNNHFDASYQPYIVQNHCSRSHQSKGKVLVAEPAAPTTYPYLPQNNIPTLNIPNIAEYVAPTFKTSLSNDSNERGTEDLTDDEAKEIMLEILNIRNPVLDNILDKCSSDTVIQDEFPRSCYPYSDPGDESGLDASPNDSDSSPVGSPQGTICLRPPQSASVKSDDSGMGSIEGCPRTPNTATDDIYPFVPDRTNIWLLPVPSVLVPVPSVPVPKTKKDRPILPKPKSAKERFAEKLNEDRKLRAYAKIYTLDVNHLVHGDAKDGDTQLMIAVSNERVGQLEIIYALVERLRNIPGSLAKVNNAGVSALYLACKLLPHQPLVAAYIAEALIDQSVDLTKLTYCGLTLPQMLKKEGNTHNEVLKELLAVKDKSDRYVFQSHHSSDVNGNI